VSLPPALVVSLDFELYWGIRDQIPLDAYRDNLLGVRQAIPAMLDLFRQRGIHATWATVGFLFCRTKQELLDAAPRVLPRYTDRSLSPYGFDGVGADEASDPFHYAPSLVQAIAKTPGQEVGTHTLSHFYCLEAGQTVDDFDTDLGSASELASRFDLRLESIVFPRNQYNPDYLPVMARRGLRAFRSTVGGWPYGGEGGPERLSKRAVRLADAYLPLTGARSFGRPTVGPDGLVDVPASVFLRPYSPRLRQGDFLKIGRICSAMDNAARRGEAFHLWWHPHNFGTYLAENMAMLVTVLDRFGELRRRYGMESLSMGEVARAAVAAAA
jgi:peptidoglycan/xylan/chitin deacetylase (PgdA/CDA1 family)